MVSDWSLIIDIGKHFMQGSKFGPQRTSNVVGSIWPPGQTDRVYKKPVTNTDNEIAIPVGIKRIPDNWNYCSFRHETDTG